jgi:hypothetical protein
VRFTETLGFVTLTALVVSGESVFYNRLSVFALLGLRGLRMVGVVPRARRLEIGHLQVATGARSNAYSSAEQHVDNAALQSWARRVGVCTGIDVPLLAEKHFFDFLFDKFMFYEVALRYVAEHPEESHSLILDPQFADTYVAKAREVQGLEVCVSWDFSLLRYAGAVFLLPLLLIFHLVRSNRGNTEDASNQVICIVDSAVTHAMFRDLFGERSDVRFAVEERNAAAVLPAIELGEINVLSLSRRAFLDLLTWLPCYLLQTLISMRGMLRFGALPFDLFHRICQGRVLAGEGKQNVFITFEHLTIARAARNEFLRSRDSVSVYVPMNSYVTYQAYPSERKINYDVFCSPGPHVEQLYIRKLARTQKFLHTGSYDAHRPLLTGGRSAEQRAESLQNYKGDGRLITVLTPGICDETLSNETRLMQLACKLARLPNVRVLLRPKPRLQGTEYSGFYRNILGTDSRVWETGDEFDLFDLVGPTDLFVSSISTSTCDVALRGGKVIFVDFMHTPDLYDPWEKVPELVLDEGGAYEKIVALISENAGGPLRQAHAVAMGRFVDYLGYRFPSHQDYKNNLLKGLRPLLPQAS